MTFLHGVKQMHTDLKSTNVLLNEDWEPKLSDFGFLDLKEKFKRFRKLKKRKDAETPYWLAPEILKSENYGRKVDVYAFGILIWEILNRRIPYETWSLEDMIQKIGMDENYQISKPESRYSQPLLDIMYKCLRRKPEKRPSFEIITGLLEEMEDVRGANLVSSLYALYGPLPRGLR